MYYAKTHLNLNGFVFKYEGAVVVCHAKVSLKVISYKLNCNTHTNLIIAFFKQA